MVEPSGTLSNICQRLKLKLEGTKIFLFVHHMVCMFRENSLNIIKFAPIEKVIVTDSLPLPSQFSNKIVQVSMADLLANIIETEHFASRIVRVEDEEIYEVE